VRSSDQRIQRELAALQEADDPLARLDAARRLRVHAEAVESELVAAARAAGVSWAKIGKLYGMSKQGAQQRFRPAIAETPPAAGVAVPPR